MSREERMRRKHERRRGRSPPPAPPPPTPEQLVAQTVEQLVAALEREARKADVIADGATLYDAEFHRIDERKRKPSDERGAFVAYPDGSRCWVHAPFPTSYDPNGGNAPNGLHHVKDARFLVDLAALDGEPCMNRPDGLHYTADGYARLGRCAAAAMLAFARRTEDGAGRVARLP